MSLLGYGCVSLLSYGYASLLQSAVQAIGVVGIVQCDFLEPIHNKQDFNKTDRYK